MPHRAKACWRWAIWKFRSGPMPELWGRDFLSRLLINTGVLSGCGLMTESHSLSPGAGKASCISALPIPMSSAVRVITEPQAGVRPWLKLMAQARTGIEVNAYLMDDPTILAGLRQAGSRGVPIAVLLAPNPYHAASWVPSEDAAVRALPNCTVKTVPGRFAGPWAYDHAKYVVVNPGTSHVAALIGSPNFTESAFDGSNLEAAVLVTGAAAQDAAAVFHADWTHTPAGDLPRHQLVLSPGDAAIFQHLLAQPGSLNIMTEELGDTPGLDAELARDGSRVHLLLPASLSTSEQTRVAFLAAAGVRIRLLSYPYVHAKVIITPSQAFLGSQNFSSVSLQKNREVGLVVTGSACHTLATWFQDAWYQAQPWTASSPTESQPVTASSLRFPSHAVPSSSTSTSRWSWLALGTSSATVRRLWGTPQHMQPMTYHGQAQIAWIYPHHTVYFVRSRVIAVVEHP